MTTQGARERRKFVGTVKRRVRLAAGKLETVKIGDRRFTTDEQQRDYIERRQRNGAD